MRNCLVPALITLSVCNAFAEAETWSEIASKLSKEKAELVKEEHAINSQIGLLEEQAKIKEEHMELLRQRLAAMNGTPRLPETLDEASAAGLDSGMSEDERKQKQDELLSRCNDRIVILRGKNGKTATAFLAPYDGKARVFSSAPWIAANGSFSVSGLNGNEIPITQAIDCPVGIGLIGLQPEKTDLPVFSMAMENEIPSVGAGILVVLASGETKALSGIGGSIRGIGPDTLEIDAELTPEMSGAPVLSLANGKLIGIVGEQVTGVAEVWARGTRHEGSRNFVARLDRSRDWVQSDLGRFAKEAAYMAKLRDKNRIAWITHTLLGSASLQTADIAIARPEDTSSREYREYENAKRRQRDEGRKIIEFATKEAANYPKDPQIARAISFINREKENYEKYTRDAKQKGHLQSSANELTASRNDLERDRTSMWRDLFSDINKKESDPSAHLSPYHKEEYRLAMKERAEGIRIITEMNNRIAR